MLLEPGERDPLMRSLATVIRVAIRAVAVLTTAVILWGVVDVAVLMGRKLLQPPLLMLETADVIALFGEIMAVIIAVEVFANVAMLLREDRLPVELVVATALTAIARKVIILDYDKASPLTLIGVAAIIIALVIGYWLVRPKAE